MLNSGHADGIMAHQDVLEQEGSRKEGKEVHNSTDSPLHVKRHI
jgi:hypothetical protein